MDNIIAESEDVQGIPELNYGIPQTAQFVTDRRQVNYFPSGSSVYSPKDNKNIRFYISGDANQYLDLSSVRLFATIQNRNNDRAKFLRPWWITPFLLSLYRYSFRADCARYCRI